MEVFWKFMLTALIWVLSAGISITALIESNGNGSIMDMTMPALIVSLIATFIIWGIPELARNANKSNANIAEAVGKSKRGSSSEDRASLLMQMMTEDEREAFKQTLKQQLLRDSRLNADGEFMSDSSTLEALLYDDNDRQKYH